MTCIGKYKHVRVNPVRLNHFFFSDVIVTENNHTLEYESYMT